MDPSSYMCPQDMESPSYMYPRYYDLHEAVEVGDNVLDEVEGEEEEHEGVSGEEENVNAIEGGQKNEFIPEAREEIKPKVEMEFLNEESAYEFYNMNGRCCGFSIRRNRTRKLKSGERALRVFTCSKEGVRRREWVDLTDRKKKAKPLTRCGCPARVKINKQKGSDKLVIMDFIEMHSHNLMTQSKCHYLRSQRNVPDSHLDVMEDLQTVGIGVVRTLNYFTNEVGGRECLGYEQMDARNALRRKRFEEYGHSAQLLLKSFSH